MYRLIARDESYRSLLIYLAHNNISEIEGGEGAYYHLSLAGFDFIDTISSTTPSLEKYLIYSSASGPIWQEQTGNARAHNDFYNLQGGGFVDGYYHLIEVEYTWLTSAYYNGFWGEVLGGVGLTSYAVGDIIYSDEPDSLNKLSVGSLNQILKVGSGIPSWQGSGLIFDHNLLNNLQGGGTALEDGYYHLSGIEYAWLNAGYVDGWEASQGGTGLSSYNAGDILYGDISSELSLLGVGTDGYALTSIGTTSSWDHNYYNAVFTGKIGEVPSGLDGYVLTSLDTDSTEVFPAQVIIIASKLSGLRVSLNQAPGVGESITITVRKNSQDTDLSVVISDTDVSGNNLESSVLAYTGDIITVRVQTTSSALAEDLSVVFLCSKI